MDPTEPTAASLESLANQGHDDVRHELLASADRLIALVPSVTGLSITKVDLDGIALTLVATTDAILPLDAMQYLDGGPCVEAVVSNKVVVANDSDPLSEEQWSLFARASSAQGVFSSLSLPLVHDDDVVGSINIYASEVDAFSDHVDQVAEVFDAWAAGAVIDADLSFEMRRTALETSQELARRDALIDHAVAIVADIKHLAADDARSDLRGTAVKAGVSEAEVARTVVLFHT